MTPSPHTIPESLCRFLDDEANSIAAAQGTLTTRVRGSHVQVTVKLRRWWSLATDWTPTDEQPAKIEGSLLRISSVGDLWIKVAVIAGMVYLAFSIVPWFFSGGSQ